MKLTRAETYCDYVFREIEKRHLQFLIPNDRRHDYIEWLRRSNVEGYEESLKEHIEKYFSRSSYRG
jgi:hypothetical protein